MKILASDFDNTLFYLDDEEANKKNIAAINEFIKNGNNFCIVTGRNYTSIKSLLNEYNIPYTYLICDDGAKIFDSVDSNLNTILLDKNDIAKVCELLDKIDCVYCLDDGYNKTDYFDDCVKIVVDSDDSKKFQEIVDYINKNIDIHIYASRFHVNIINRNVNKRNALLKLIELEKIDRNNLYVIGDNDNDYEMLEEFNGAVIKKHNSKLDTLKKNEYNYLSDYIDYLLK